MPRPLVLKFTLERFNTRRKLIYNYYMHIPTTPPAVLTVLYWLHMLATVIWIGGLASLSLIVLPAAHKTLEPGAYSALLTRLQAGIQQTGWFSLAVLTATGLFQMSASRFYGGFLAINNPWSVAILSKHIAVGLMVLVSGYVTWGVLPRIQRTALLRAAGRLVAPEVSASLERQEVTMLRVNLILSVIVLLLTAWARSAG